MVSWAFNNHARDLRPRGELGGVEIRLRGESDGKELGFASSGFGLVVVSLFGRGSASSAVVSFSFGSRFRRDGKPI
jgi:hypothetical protein